MLLLLTWSGDAFGTHACSHHDAIGKPGTAAHAGMPEHGGHATPDHGKPGQGSPEHGGACTCLGSCLTGTAAPLPSAAVLPVAFVVSVPVVAIPATTRHRPARLAYILPYATAPPVRLA